ncbi:hypothetical protein FHX37_2483 [Haloactinospora alba]|uniref:Uncharacterized protein n=1 Tax=Haloactinospora alba TaxID=405555 RepID=A0A543NL16_9ACTN|nr:hypothetical protein [Haloactinospora alba]TQN32520.1 hypothetical protein FHX37_2483 [Haloactinospora alba]
MSGDKPPLVNPDEIPFTDLAPEYLETVARNVKDDGGNIADSGNTIRSTWQGLGEVYSAPESGQLLSAVDRVAELGDDISDALTSVADALVTFAEEGGKAKKELVALRGEARDFLESIEAEGEDWNKDEDAVAEHRDLRGRINAAIVAYQEAERKCANAITSLFAGGTTFVAGNAQEPTPCRAGEQVYGLEEIPEQASMPWGGPQAVDAPFYVDAAAGAHDLWLGNVREAGSMLGVHRDGDWGVESGGEWLANEKAYWYETYQSTAALTGLYTPRDATWGVDSAGEWAANATRVRVEMAHAMVPWREWDERPGYVITQGGANISTAIGGAVLGATGVGAPAGAALASRAGLPRGPPARACKGCGGCAAPTRRRETCPPAPTPAPVRSMPPHPRAIHPGPGPMRCLTGKHPPTGARTPPRNTCSASWASSTWTPNKSDSKPPWTNTNPCNTNSPWPAEAVAVICPIPAPGSETVLREHNRTLPHRRETQVPVLPAAAIMAMVLPGMAAHHPLWTVVPVTG